MGCVALDPHWIFWILGVSLLPFFPSTFLVLIPRLYGIYIKIKAKAKSKASHLQCHADVSRLLAGKHI